MKCGSYCAKGNKNIVLHKSDGWETEIRYIAKSYSSLMLCFVLFCCPVAETEEEEIKGCINLYHEDEKAIDAMLKDAIDNAYVDLDLYYDEDGYEKPFGLA